jgi:hypothetical protein
LGGGTRTLAEMRQNGRIALLAPGKSALMCTPSCARVLKKTALPQFIDLRRNRVVAAHGGGDWRTLSDAGHLKSHDNLAQWHPYLQMHQHSRRHATRPKRAKVQNRRRLAPGEGPPLCFRAISPRRGGAGPSPPSRAHLLKIGERPNPRSERVPDLGFNRACQRALEIRVGRASTVAGRGDADCGRAVAAKIKSFADSY